MNWVDLHLMVNHFPIILIVAGSLAAIAALFARSPGLWRYAFITVLLAALTSPVAYVSGLQAEEIVEEKWYVEHEQVEEHEASGLYALVALLVAGVSAAVALWRRSKGTQVTFAILSIVAAVTTAYSALEGGEIVHDAPALEQARSPVAPPPANTGR